MKHLIALSLLTLPLLSTAQTSKRSGVGLSVGVMGTTIDAGEFNALVPDGIPEIKDGFRALPVFGLSIGALRAKGFYAEIKFAGRTRKKEETGHRLEEVLAYTEYNLGYRFVQKGHHLFGVSLGLGYGTWKAGYYTDLTGQTFTNMITLPMGEVTFKSGNMYSVNPGISYHFGLDKSNSMQLGIDAGYRIGLNTRQWSLYKSSLVNSPEQKLSGGFLAISLCVGG